MERRTPLVLLGAGGHAKVCIEVLRASGAFDLIGCLDPLARASVLGVPVLGDDRQLTRLLAEGVRHAFVAIGDNALRQAAARRLEDAGMVLPCAVDPTAHLSPSCQVGEGVLVMPGVIVNAQARVESLAILNTGAIIEHDCVIGRAAHVAPGAVLAGGVKIGERVLIGAGTAVRPGISIAADAIVGAGSAVAADLTRAGRYGGTPARRLSPSR